MATVLGWQNPSPVSEASTRKHIGEWLVNHGAISTEQLQQALLWQTQTQSRLGTILTHKFGVCHQHLRDALAAQAQLPALSGDLDQFTDPLLDAAHRTEYLRHHLVPLRLDANNVLHAACPEPGRAAEIWLYQHFPQAARIEWHLCTHRDIRQLLRRHLGSSLAQYAADRVYSQHPRMSARTTLLAAQSYSALFWLTLAIVTLILMPRVLFWSLWSAMQVIAVAGLVFKAFILLRGARAVPAIAQLPGFDQAPWKNTPASELPVYSVLVPLYREAAMVPHLLARLHALDYPRDKLDIKCLVEADDTETWDALRAAKPEGCIEIIAVPPGEPRTKPKACNYALPYLRGSLVTIYDAEDAPKSDQLRMAAWAFAQVPATVACLQAKLTFYNRSQNLITQWFTLEYTMWFHIMLAGLERDHFPMPLGGTSNHLRRYALEQVGGWDAYNVTEDADLGMRLERFGLRTLLLPSHTWEEAPHTIWDWMMQRTRWIKGYMQTWCVHLRTPFRDLRRLGFRHVLGFHLFIGAPCLLYLSLPVLLGISLCSLLWTGLVPPLASACGWLALGLAFCLHAVIAPLLLKRLPPLPKAFQYMQNNARILNNFSSSSLSFPLYWLLHCCASLRALFQLVHAPHFWDKTNHGHSLRFLSLRRT